MHEKEKEKERIHLHEHIQKSPHWQNPANSSGLDNRSRDQSTKYELTSARK